MGWVMQVTANRPPAAYTVELSEEEATLLAELLIRRSDWREGAPYGCDPAHMYSALAASGVQRATTYSLTASDDY